MRRKQCIKTVKFWSDGCANQFRNQYAYCILKNLDNGLKIQWNFIDANHGKTAVDGAGVTVENAVYCCIISGYVVIKTSKQLTEHADSIVQNIHVIHLPANELVLHIKESVGRILCMWKLLLKCIL